MTLCNFILWGIKILQTSERRKKMVHIQNVRNDDGFKVLSTIQQANMMQKYSENIFT